MRKVENSQIEFGEIAIGEIHIEAKSQDRASRGAQGNSAHLHESANASADLYAVVRTGSSRHQSEDASTRHRFMASIASSGPKTGIGF